MLFRIFIAFHIFLIGVLVVFMLKNRYLIQQLKTDINEYINKDMETLKKILDGLSEKNKTKEKDFVLSVLEEDEQFQVLNRTKTKTLNDNLTSTHIFKKMF